MTNPETPEFPINALIGLGGRPIEARSTLTFSEDTDRALFITHLGVVTTAALDTRLAGYVTSEALAAAIAAVPSPDLSAYVTSGALATALAGYSTTAGLATTLAGYVTTGALTTALGSYVTATALALRLPAPTGDNAGKFLQSNGVASQWTDAPGQPLIRGSGLLQGDVTPGAAQVTASADFSWNPIATGMGVQGFSVSVDGNPAVNILADPDGTLNPADYPSDLIIQTGGATINAGDVATAMATRWGDWFITSSSDDHNLTIARTSPGGSTSLVFDAYQGSLSSIGNPLGNWSFPATFNGADGSDPSGSIDEVELVGFVEGKNTRVVSFGFDVAPNTPWEFSLKDDSGSYTPLRSFDGSEPGGTYGPNGDSTAISFWISGLAGSLVARTTGAPGSIPFGQQLNVWALAERY